MKLYIKAQKAELETYINNKDYEIKYDFITRKDMQHTCANNNENTTNLINEEESSSSKDKIIKNFRFLSFYF